MQTLRRKWTETANNWNFSKFKGNYSFKNCTIETITKLDLDIILIKLFTNFFFSMWDLCEENKRKVLLDRHTDRPTDRKTDSSKEIVTWLYALHSSKGYDKLCKVQSKYLFAKLKFITIGDGFVIFIKMKKIW